MEIRKKEELAVKLEIVENQMDTAIVDWGYIRVMENKMEATIVLVGGS